VNPIGGGGADAHKGEKSSVHESVIFSIWNQFYFGCLFS